MNQELYEHMRNADIEFTRCHGITDHKTFDEALRLSVVGFNTQHDTEFDSNESLQDYLEVAEAKEAEEL